MKLELERIKHWISKGAQPSDRIKRFLDAAGVLKREARNNPEKAKPKKKGEEAAAAAAAPAAAPAAAAAAAPAPEAPAAETPAAS